MKFTGTIPKGQPTLKPVSAFKNGHWEFPEQMAGQGWVGFVYVIYDKELSRGYIGKKQYYGTGKLNNGKESNWRTYKTSSPLLKEHFAVRPLSEFEFICLEQYRTKGTLSYSETWSLCFVEAPTTKLYYNTLIEKVSWRVSEPISARHRERLIQFMERVKGV